ncbi:MAG: SurA N-terminal domain-containing protein [Bdellovibrionales bacterium]|nr:SurA N-terminal domain-containing protein [Bdellovibrionales bacterium]
MKIFTLVFLYTCIFIGGLQAEIVIDRVIASVDGEPITLQDLKKKSGAKENFQAEDINQSERLRAALNQLIVEQVIFQEAKKKSISVAPQEIEQYIETLAGQNGLSVPDFKKALKKEGRDLEQLKAQVKVEILRSRIIGQMQREGVSVTKQDITEQIDEESFTDENAPYVKLRQILINTNGQEPGIPEARLQQVMEKLGTETFSEVAKRYSDGTEAQDGGLVGILSTSELSELIKGAIENLPAKTPSQVVQSFSGYHLFFLDAIYEDAEAAQAAHMKLLKGATKEKKTQEHIAQYFKEELPKSHVIEELF